MIRGFTLTCVALAMPPVFADVSSDERRKLTLRLGENVRMQFVWIKPGKFKMGSPADEKARQTKETLHEVRITKRFWMQTTKVTQAQWEALMGSNPSHFKGNPNLPVEQVSWDDCQEFLKKLNEVCKNQLGKLRADLPTEAEWEYACRAGSTGRWSFGEDETKLGDYAWYSENSGNRMHPVGQKKPNAWGLYDMHGNVWEWCKDWYGEYEKEAVINPQGPANGQARLLRGGSWDDVPLLLRSAYRFRVVPRFRVRIGGIGGRVVLR
jgi:formylglycine-generating enzyme required for sulfatase activity